MYKKLVFEEFFSDENQSSLAIMERKIAATLISPKQVVHAIPDDIIDINHLDLSLNMIADMYKINKPVFNGDIGSYRYRLLRAINEVIKNDERNFVLIRYILIRTARIAVVEAPHYITEFERDSLLALDDVFKDYKIDTDVLIHRYDPINMENMHGDSEGFDHNDGKDAIKDAIEYYENFHLISDYELLAPKEYILK